MKPDAPVYIVSKGRWESRLTSKALHQIGVPHYIVVEAAELAEYQAVVDASATLLVLDKAYQRDYDTCDGLGDSKSKGPGPARNFAWDHSIALGSSWHWVMDDNIARFMRMNRNLKIPVADGTIFKVMEDFAARYVNVAMVGPNYEYLVKRKFKLQPFHSNTRIYSCNLIRNDVPYRWRGRYNEDTDLSLRMLKDRWCTVLFDTFLQAKAGTQTMGGGNTKEFYALEGTQPKSEMQVRLHPDVSWLVWKFGRVHHHVDYTRFKHKLIREPKSLAGAGVNDYGMKYETMQDGLWSAANLPVLCSERGPQEEAIDG